jgi:hypothetical protein
MLNNNPSPTPLVRSRRTLSLPVTQLANSFRCAPLVGQEEGLER